ncbi:hypothetical protein HOLleu_07270 [Holothuria leucospilota]|uniref:RNA-directed DNA polymerase from mobile element jockey n=1 Tax=Holothuria leucospilota TaxID=206669 RepID=A0A9Q1HFZ5_HOLLE|nr:hypothetical protein HOLleu_07270 [Holothuria leucospilota]
MTFLGLDISQTVNSANKVLGLLKRNLWNCSPSIKETAYKSLVRPKREYASSIWDPYCTTHIDSIEKVQQDLLKMINAPAVKSRTLHTRNTHTMNYIIPSANKDCYRYSLYPRTIPLWNHLPPELKSAPSVGLPIFRFTKW